MLSIFRSAKKQPIKPTSDFAGRFKEIPTDLVRKVNGNTTEEGFRHIGASIAAGIGTELAAISQARGSSRDMLGESQRILDFGSGLGRVLLQLKDRAPDAELFGFDIDPLMNKWAEHLLTGEKVGLVSSTLEFPAGHFDLITVISVFTHLDKTTDFWLSEIHRLLSPTGLAFITYQDDTLFEEMNKQGAFPPGAKIEAKYVVGASTSEGGASMGTFYTTPHWKEILEKFFNVEVLKPRGLFRHQSISIVTRKEVPIDRQALYRTYMASLEHEIYELRRQHEIAY